MLSSFKRDKGAPGGVAGVAPFDLWPERRKLDVWIIPLATFGFIATDPIINPVTWWLVDASDKVVGGAFQTLRFAKAWARAKGYRLPDEDEDRGRDRDRA